MAKTVTQDTINGLTEKGRHTMTAIGGLAFGNCSLSFFDDGVTVGSGSWGECLTGELGHKSSGVLVGLVKRGLLASYSYEEDGDGTWYELTDLGVAVALELAKPEEAPAPEPKQFMCNTCLALVDFPGRHCTGTAIEDHDLARLQADRRRGETDLERSDAARTRAWDALNELQTKLSEPPAPVYIQAVGRLDRTTSTASGYPSADRAPVATSAPETLPAVHHPLCTAAHDPAKSSCSR
jgi:hypothetical protein